MRPALPAANPTPRANLQAPGLTTFDAIRLLVAIEREFGVTFPRQMPKRETMASIISIVRVLRAMQALPAASTELGAA
jgi:acyl carrier protein